MRLAMVGLGKMGLNMTRRLLDGGHEVVAMDRSGEAEGHLDEYYVGCGQSVWQGDVIGTVGSSGNSTGPHLHFEMMFEGVRLVSFAQVLKHGAFPLAAILAELLERCSQGTAGEHRGVSGGGEQRNNFV